MMENPKQYANPQLLIGPRELASELEDETTRPTLLDLRPAELFAAGTHSAARCISTCSGSA